MQQPPRNTERAQAVIDFCEQLLVTTGGDQGKTLKLRDWQKAFIRDVYEPSTESGARLVRRAVFSLARKQGKTEISGALCLNALVGSECAPNSQIILAANSREQASHCFDAIKRQVEANPYLAEYVTVVDSKKRIIVHSSEHRGRGSYIKVISADAGTALGLSPRMVIYDELCAAPNDRLFNALDTSMGAHTESLFLTISTQSNDPSHVLSQMIDYGLSDSDPTTVCHLYCADEDCALDDEEQWLKANPALGDFCSLEDIRILAKRAIEAPSFEAAFRNFHLNQRVNPYSTFVNPSDWRKAAGDADLINGEEIVLALDYAKVGDLCALTAVSLTEVARVQAWFWKPSDGLEKASKTDGRNYALLAKQGHLNVCQGRVMNPADIVAKIIELSKRYIVRALVYDPWGTDQLLALLDKHGFSAQIGQGAGLVIEKFGQGLKSMSPALDAFEFALLSNQIVHPNHPLLNFCVNNAVATVDPAGNRKLDKSMSKMRIDGAVSLVMAMGYRATLRDEVKLSNPWDDEGFSLFEL